MCHDEHCPRVHAGAPQVRTWPPHRPRGSSIEEARHTHGRLQTRDARAKADTQVVKREQEGSVGTSAGVTSALLQHHPSTLAGDSAALAVPLPRPPKKSVVVPCHARLQGMQVERAPKRRARSVQHGSPNGESIGVGVAVGALVGAGVLAGAGDPAEEAGSIVSIPQISGGFPMLAHVPPKRSWLHNAPHRSLT